MKKYFILASLILLAAACGKQAAVQNNTAKNPTSIAGNQTPITASYKNDQYGFSFTYPSVLVASSCSDGSCLAYFGKNGSNELSVNVGNGYPIGGGNFTQGTVAGKTAYFKQTGAENSSTDLVLVPFMSGGKQYTLYLGFNYSKPAAADDAISSKDKILASLKFSE